MLAIAMGRYDTTKHNDLAAQQHKVVTCHTSLSAASRMYLAGDDKHKGAAAVALNVRRRIPQVADKLVQICQTRHQELAAVWLHAWGVPGAAGCGLVIRCGLPPQHLLRLGHAIAGRLAWRIAAAVAVAQAVRRRRRLPCCRCQPMVFCPRRCGQLPAMPHMPLPVPNLRHSCR